MRKYDIDGMRFYSHFPDMIHGKVDTDSWEHRFTTRQVIGISLFIVAVVAFSCIGFNQF
jgi:hypothetical protein